jgi:MFS family permease
MPTFVSASTTHLLIGAALIIGMVAVPLMAGTVGDATPLEGGLRLLRMTVALGVGALVGGVLTQRFGPRGPALAGLAMAAAGFTAMSQWTVDIADPWLTVHLAVAGSGFGLLVAPVTDSSLRYVTGVQRGAASALITVARMIGMTVGLAALTAWGTSRFEDLVAGLPAFSNDPAVQEQIRQAAIGAALEVFTAFFRYAAFLCIAAIIPALLMTRRQRMHASEIAPDRRLTAPGVTGTTPGEERRDGNS